MKKTVLITGASSGIGKAAAELFSSKGWQVAATMRHTEAAKDWASQHSVRLYTLDVTSKASVESAVTDILRDFGRIDVLVNNAGYGLAGPLETASEDKIMQQFQTNVFGVMRCIQAVLPGMRGQQDGVIVNITSIGGLVALPFNAIYHATKFGIDGMSESLNFELAPFNIRVKTVAPGGVATDFASRSLVRTTEEGVPSPYDAGMAATWAAFSKRQADGHSQPMQIAEVIYTAATDGSAQLNYLAGADAERMYTARRQMAREDFHSMVKTSFGL